MVLNTPVLLDVSAFESSGTLELRIDQNPLGTAELDQDIKILKLHGCDDWAETLAKLRPGVGETIEYGAEDRSPGFQLYIDYDVDGVKVLCSSIEETYEELSIDDLAFRCRFLASRYQSAFERAERLYDRYDTFVTRLRREVEKELDRAKRKEEFFSESSQRRAEIGTAARKAYEQVISWIDRLLEEAASRRQPLP